LHPLTITLTGVCFVQPTAIVRYLIICYPTLVSNDNKFVQVVNMNAGKHYQHKMVTKLCVLSGGIFSERKQLCAKTLGTGMLCQSLTWPLVLEVNVKVTCSPFCDIYCVTSVCIILCIEIHYYVYLVKSNNTITTESMFYRHDYLIIFIIYLYILIITNLC